MNGKTLKSILWWVLFLISTSPAVFSYHLLNNKNTINVYESIMTISGHTSFFFLIVTLAITPMRRWLTNLFKGIAKIPWGKRLSDWNLLIRYRRFMGLAAFYYAAIHLITYFYLELDLDFSEFIYDLTTRLHIIFGLSTFVLMLILAATSPKWVIKKMGRLWRPTHRLMYLLSITAVVHYVLAVKVTDTLPWIYAVVVTTLLLHRVLVRSIKALHRPEDTGLEHFRK